RQPDAAFGLLSFLSIRRWASIQQPFNQPRAAADVQASLVDVNMFLCLSADMWKYFSGLLSGNIRINSAPLYLTHVTVLGAPSFEVAADDGSGGGGCRAFLKVYEGLVPVYTSGVHSVAGGTRQFTVNVAGERHRRGLQLRGDILLKCYHRCYQGGIAPPPSHAQGAQGSRELVFSCQFHTCAVTDYTLSFTRQELDHAC
ncbi:unnamed protein product, partial [Timema podura]|nr:unnamed protein product [Timema podura]